MIHKRKEPQCHQIRESYLEIPQSCYHFHFDFLLRRARSTQLPILLNIMTYQGTVVWQ